VSADVPPQGTVSQRHSHIPQDRILNKTTAATTSLSQISYAVNYQRCFLCQWRDRLTCTRAGTSSVVSRRSVTARRRHSKLCSLEILVWTRSLPRFVLVILSHVLSFTSSTRVQSMESSRKGRVFSVLWSVETGSGNHITYCVVESEGPLTGLKQSRCETN
jgi:hypothetical protein